MKTRTHLPLLIIALILGLVAAGFIATGKLNGGATSAWAAPASGEAAIHCVLGGQSIQAAIDAAAPDDIIALDSKTFTQTIVINKSITLSGGWQDNCTRQPLTDTTVIFANQMGRAITIQAAVPGTKVRLEYLVIRGGDATGLGGADPHPDPALPGLEAWTTAHLATIAAPTTTAQNLNWRAPLESAYRNGVFPAGEKGYAAWTARIENLLKPSAWPTAALPRATDMTRQARLPSTTNADEIDCGGGIYDDGAALEVHELFITQNIASRTGPGYGGGLCGVNLPAAGITLDGDTQFKQNIASLTDDGAGGAMYVDGGDQAQVLLKGHQVLDENVTFLINAASQEKRGYGGGLAIYNSPAVSLDYPGFYWNLGGRSTDKSDYESGLSYGGGFYLQNCPDAKLTGIVLTDNMADAGGIEGLGGGAAVVKSDNVEISEGTYFGRNTAHANVGLFGATGLGGGLALMESANAHIHDATLEFNAGSLYAQGYGGGMFGFNADNLLLEDNRFYDNTGAFYPNGNIFGGGASLIESGDVTIRSNDFKRNALGVLGLRDALGFGSAGGGLGMDSSQNVLVQENTFTENTGMFAGLGHGAGMMVGGESKNVEISHNTFTKNVSARQDALGAQQSIGEGAGVTIDDASFINVHHNLFVNNSGTTSGYVGSVIMVTGFIPGTEVLGSTDITIEGNRILDSGHDPALTDTFEAGGIRVNLTEWITISNNIIANSTSYGMQLEYDDNQEGQNAHALVVNNTLVDNADFGLGFANNWSQECLTVSNNIVAGSTVGMVTDSYNTVDVDHNLFYNNGANLDGSLTMSASVLANPQFVDAAGQDYHLQWFSPARDAGAGIPPAPVVDLEGILRPFGPAVDIGAYEWHRFILFFPFIGVGP